MVNKLIDHTLLKAFAKTSDIEKLCNEAKENHFKSVCVNPVNVALAAKLLKGSDVLVCTVIGFPLGANTIAIKEAETIDAVNNGAQEIDMVINVGKAKEHDFAYIEKEIAAVVKASKGNTVKVIIETCYLDDFEKAEVCKAATRAHAHFVKTSTGFSKGGATVEAIKLIRKAVGAGFDIKASGGIRTAEDMKKMIEAGATRIGTSNGVNIMKEIY